MKENGRIVSKLENTLCQLPKSWFNLQGLSEGDDRRADQILGRLEPRGVLGC